MSSTPQDVNHTFDDDDLSILTTYGTVKAHEAGEILVPSGTSKADCLVTLSGQTHIFVISGQEESRVGYMERGQFAGDLSVLTGGVTFARTVMGEAGEVLHIPHDRFKRLLVERSALSDVFVRVLTARREFGKSRANRSIILIGPGRQRETFALRRLLERQSVPHTLVDPTLDEEAGEGVMRVHGLGPEDLPAVLLGEKEPMRAPTPSALAEALGLDLVADGTTTDVLVIGAGPAGLAASVYAGSEGLSVLTLDGDAPGGQAGTSSKIENYLGFPTGISGQELADRASVQAQKFGVQMAAPAEVASLQVEDKLYRVALEDGREVAARSVVIATGARYRRLDIDHLEDFEGRGIYYGATPMEAQLCGGREVAIVGAGNSAGQGAVFLSHTAKAVHVVYRRADIRETMSEYLVRRLEETPNIILHPEREVVALYGDNDGLLEKVDFINHATGSTETCDCGFLFLFIGARPCTDWLQGRLATDDRGFLKTGADLTNMELVKAQWSMDRMPTKYETSLPRVYAVGDVRTGSIKRVASAVGEGSVVVSDIHRALGELAAS